MLTTLAQRISTLSEGFLVNNSTEPENISAVHSPISLNSKALSDFLASFGATNLSSEKVLKSPLCDLTIKGGSVNKKYAPIDGFGIMIPGESNVVVELNPADKDSKKEIVVPVGQFVFFDDWPVDGFPDAGGHRVVMPDGDHGKRYILTIRRDIGEFIITENS